jgi:hypothetical protein
MKNCCRIMLIAVFVSAAKSDKKWVNVKYPTATNSNIISCMPAPAPVKDTVDTAKRIQIQ